MGGRESKTRVSAPKTDTTVPIDVTEKYLLVWLDGELDDKNTDCQNSLDKLNGIVNIFIKCTTVQQCIQHLTDNKEKITFVISSGALGQQLVPEIHNMPKLNAIYIFCANKRWHEEWTIHWHKIKGVHTSIEPICEGLQQVIKRLVEHQIPMTIISVNQEGSSENLNRLEPTFMYSQIFKEILLDMNYDKRAVKDLLTFFKKGKIYNDVKELKLIKEFQTSYKSSDAINWYTRDCSIYKTLNEALRTLNGDIIIRMGFFLCDVHRQIESLHQQQMIQIQGKTLTVYRGQRLSMSDLKKLEKNKGGLLAFNSFLSTSEKKEVAEDFCRANSESADNLVAILYRITIDPTVSTAPFAFIEKVSAFREEAEILFSMHTVFRIDDIQKSDSEHSFYQVELKLTSDDDKQLRRLTERIRREAEGPTGWARLAQLLMKIGQFEKAEELYSTLLDEASTDNDKAIFYNQLGIMKCHQGKYKAAVTLHEKSLKLKQKTLSENHPDLAISYNNIGQVYSKQGDYSKALAYYEKGLEIKKKTFTINDSSLATSYSNIGSAYENMGDYSKALEFYEKDLEITKNTSPKNHPNLAVSYNNIGQVYNRMNDNIRALEFYKKAHQIKKIALPPIHPELAISYNNLGVVYKKMGSYSEALEFYEKVLQINENILSTNHPDLATTYNNMGAVYDKMGDSLKALELYKKANKIWNRALHSNHPTLASSFNNIGMVYFNMGDFSKALSYLEKALAIRRKTLPEAHPLIKQTIDSIDFVKEKI